MLSDGIVTYNFDLRMAKIKQQKTISEYNILFCLNLKNIN